MTVDASKSAFITNAIAVPRVLNNPHLRGPIREAIGYNGTVTAAAEAASKYFFFRVPSKARMSELLLTAADFTTAGAVDIGLWRTAEDGGAVVDRDYFCSALAMTGGPFARSNQMLESGVNTIANSEQAIWQILGLTSDPNVEYDVIAYVTTAFDGGQPMQLIGRWVE
jgi:hypothetical protein